MTTGRGYTGPGIVIKEVRPTVDIRPTGGSRFYPEFWPGPNERWKVFLNSFPPVGLFPPFGPLVPGVATPLIDVETFLPAPYTSAAGWYARFAEWMGTFDQTTMLVNTMDVFPPFILQLPVQTDRHEYEQIAFLDSRYWDPNAAAAHIWDFQITNTSGVNAIGCVQIALLLERHGTPEMTHKTVRCPKCSKDTQVPIQQTDINCPHCGFSFKVPYFGGGVI